MRDEDGGVNDALGRFLFVDEKAVFPVFIEIHTCRRFTVVGKKDAGVRVKDEREKGIMKTLTEIESEVEALSPDQKYMLYRFLEGQLKGAIGAPFKRQSVLDIPTVNLGKILRPLTGEDDLLGEMLEEQG